MGCSPSSAVSPQTFEAYTKKEHKKILIKRKKNKMVDIGLNPIQFDSLKLLMSDASTSTSDEEEYRFSCLSCQTRERIKKVDSTVQTSVVERNVNTHALPTFGKIQSILNVSLSQKAITNNEKHSISDLQRTFSGEKQHSLLTFPFQTSLETQKIKPLSEIKEIPMNGLQTLLLPINEDNSQKDSNLISEVSTLNGSRISKLNSPNARMISIDHARSNKCSPSNRQMNRPNVKNNSKVRERLLTTLVIFLPQRATLEKKDVFKKTNSWTSNTA